MNKRFPVERIAYDAVLSAVTVALGFFALDLGTFKFTFENFPIILAGFLFGPLDGALVGLVGIFLAQVIRYGVDISTPLWILPYVLSGLYIGLVSRARNKEFAWWQLLLILLVNALLVTGVNTFSLYIYRKFILHVPVETMIADVPLRIATNLIKAVLFTALTALLLPPLRSLLKKMRNQS